MNNNSEFYLELVSKLSDLDAIYEQVGTWLKKNIKSTPLVFYQPHPLEDLPLRKETEAKPVLLRGETIPENISKHQIEKNEAGILDLDHYLIHLKREDRWLGAIETPEPLPENITENLEMISTLMNQATNFQQKEIQATISGWFQNISESLSEPEGYTMILDYLVREACVLIDCPKGGFYAQAGDDYRLETSYGFEPEIEREKRTITHEKITSLDFTRKELVVEVGGEEENSYDLYIPVQSLKQRMGILVLYGRKSTEPLSRKKRYLLAVLSQMGHFTLSQHEIRSQQTKIIEDGLTGLKTGAYFRQRLDQEIARGKRYNCKSALLLLDIDNFSELNKNYGHSAGDAILREFGRLIKNCFRTVDISCRFSTDQFGVYFPETNLSNALVATTRFHSLVEKPIFKVDGEFIEVKISGGVAGFPEAGETTEDIMKQAQLALYAAKQTGRNKIISSSHL